MATIKGFIKDYQNNILLPITRGELLLDTNGNLALTSAQYAVGATGPDGKQNLFGLMSLAEKQMLTGSTSGQGITDIYEKLGFINDGIKIGTNILHFYDYSKAEGERYTPITIQGTAGRIVITNVGNIINADLATVTVTNTNKGAANHVVKAVEVDDYGRVTSVTNALLTNSEIPSELTEKTLTEAILKNAKTHADLDEKSDNSAVANKKYVDDKFNTVNATATGVLHFKGSLSNSTDAGNVLKAENVNGYYKVTSEFILSESQIHQNTQPVQNGQVIIDAGDTLIIHYVDNAYKFVHIPAGDDITTITVKENGSVQGSPNLDGHVVFNFDKLFDVVVTGKQFDIAIPEVSQNTDGYLTATSYRTIMAALENSGKTKFVSNLTGTEAGIYNIGTLTIGTQDHELYGINNISALTLEQGTDNTNVNPILKFVEQGINGLTKNITIEGSNGVKAEKSGDVIKLTGTYSIDVNSIDYLSLTGTVIGAKFGSRSGAAITEGLVKYSEFAIVKEKAEIAYNAMAISQAIVLEGSIVTGAEGWPGGVRPQAPIVYQYGNEALKEAVTVTI